MKKKTVNFVTRSEAWEVLKSLENRHMWAFLLYKVSARVAKTCRNEKKLHGKNAIPHNYPNLQKLVMIKTSFNSDYKTRIDNQLVREGKNLDEYKQGVNNMPIDFVSNNKVAGKYLQNTYKTSQKTIINDDLKKEVIKTKTLVKSELRNVVCHFPTLNSNPKILQYTQDGIEVSKKALKKLDIMPIHYAPTNQGIEQKDVEINKMYFDGLIAFTVNKVRYLISE